MTTTQLDKSVFITGGAGFIGSHLVDRFLERGDSVTVYDNLSTGFEEFLSNASRSARFKFVKGDLLDTALLESSMAGADTVIHMAANADVRFGLEHPERDLQQNTIATFNVLEAVRKNRVKRIAFASTGSIYGEAKQIPTPEDCPFPVQTSLYGASKLACEGLLQAYSEGFGIQSFIFRFVSVMGERYTHGHVFDFLKKLEKNPNELEVLGDGTQRKSYMYVHDCIDAIFLALDKCSDKVNIFNLGQSEYVSVNDSIAVIAKTIGVNPKLQYSGGSRGWVGDNPFIFLECKKIRALGWEPKATIAQCIVKTVQWLKENRWVLEKRH